MPMENSKIFDGDIRDIFRNEIVAHSIRILRERGWYDEEIKKEMLRDFSIKAEVLDEMLKA